LAKKYEVNTNLAALKIIIVVCLNHYFVIFGFEGMNTKYGLKEVGL
jgi:hypothetical protein